MLIKINWCFLSNNAKWKTTKFEIKFLSYYNKLLYLSFLQLFVKPGIPVRQAGLLKNKKIKTPSKKYMK